MRLFSEKVEPTFTSSDLNILTVESLEEVFFDVYEFEINGSKFIAEKRSQYKGAPVVNIPVVKGSKEYSAPFVLREGKFEVLFNENNTTFVGSTDIPEHDLSIFEQEEVVEDIVLEKKDDILKDIKNARLAAKEYAEKIKELKLQEADSELKLREEKFNTLLKEAHKSLIEEFLNITEDTKAQIFNYNEETEEKLSDYINNSIEKYTSDFTLNIESNYKKSTEALQEKVESLTKDIYVTKITDLIEERSTSSAESIENYLQSKVDKKQESQNKKITEIKSDIVTLEKVNTEINDSIIKGVNRALSRIGNVKKDIDSDISILKESIDTKFINAEQKVKDYYDEKISLVKESFESEVLYRSEENKKAVYDLIEESKTDLLHTISQIKNDTPGIVIEKYGEKNIKIDPKKIQRDIQTNLNQSFNQQILSLKKSVEMMGGGGSVATQFAAGGTMNGELNVVGNILSGGTNLLDIFGTSSGGGGGTTTTSVSTQGLTAQDATIFGTLCATTIDATSAFVKVIDVTQYELTGFDINGDFTISGKLSANDGLSATGGNIYFSDNVGIGINRPTESLHLGDDCVLALGNDSDLSMWKCNADGASYIQGGTGGNLIIREPDGNIYLQGKSGEGGVAIRANSCVQLYYDGSEKLKTQSTGVDVTGTITSDGHDIGGDLSVVGSISATKGLSAAAVAGNSYFGGNVGIGTIRPSQALTVAGTASADKLCGIDVCGKTSVCGGLFCSSGNICAGSGIVYGGSCVCGACVTDGYSCFDGSGNVCGSYGCFSTQVASPCICGSTCVCGAVVKTGYSCMDGSGNVCATYNVKGACGCFSSCTCSPKFITSDSNCTIIQDKGVCVLNGGLSSTCNVESNYFNGNVGVGINRPGAKLSIVGDISATKGLSAAAVAGTSYFGGSVGIGTHRPGYPLHIIAPATASTSELIAQFQVSDDASSYVGIGNNNSGNNKLDPTVIGYNYCSNCIGLNLLGGLRADTTSSPAINIQGKIGGHATGSAMAATTKLACFTNYGTNPTVIMGSGNLGLGDTTPDAKLSIVGDVSATGGLSAAAVAGTSYFGGSVGIGTNAPLEALTVAGNISALGTLSAGVVGAPGSEWSYLGSKVGISNDSNHFLLPTAGDNEAGLHIKSKGDVALVLEADTDNSGESDNPKIKLIQDGGGVCGNVFLNGNAATSLRIPANAMVMGTGNDYPVAITQNNYAAISIGTNNCVGIRTCDTTRATFSVAGTISSKNLIQTAQTNYTTITDAAEMTWDACKGHAATVTLGGNRCLHNPSNLAQGSYILKVVQDGTGSRTLSTGYAYHWPGGVAPTLTTGANAVDILTFWSDGTNLYGGVQYNFSLPS